MRNAAELEQMVQLLALSAEIIKKAASAEEGLEQGQLARIAEKIEGAADDLADLLFPKMTKSQ